MTRTTDEVIDRFNRAFRERDATLLEDIIAPDCVMESVHLSVDIDVVDPGMAPGTGTPEAGGMLPRELLRAVRQIVGRAELAGMDVVEVSPPYDHAEVTAILAHRTVMEAISALAVQRGMTRDTRSLARGLESPGGGRPAGRCRP